MTYNEFAQITPFPAAWDVTAAGAAAGSGGCSTGAYGAASTDAACAKVWTYLTGLAANPSSYATQPDLGRSSTARTRSRPPRAARSARPAR